MSNNIIIFEDDLVNNFDPITLTRSASRLRLGTSDILENIVKLTNPDYTALFVRKYLENNEKQVNSEQHKSKKLDINEINANGDVILINSLIKTTDSEICKILKKKEKYIGRIGKRIILAKVPIRNIKLTHKNNKLPKIEIENINKYKKIDLSAKTIMQYPWELIEENYNILKNSKKKIGKKVNIGKYVSINEKSGIVSIDDQVEIEDFSIIEGPCYIGKNTKIRSAKIRRGTSIGKNCTVGGEIENSIIHEYSNKAHDGYIGNSIIGSWVNMGASTTNSNLKNTYGEIKVKIGNKTINTHTQKYGMILADGVKTSIGTMINSTVNVGVSSHIQGRINKNVPSFTIYNSDNNKMTELYQESGIQTQKRMMERRNIQQNKTDVKLLRDVYILTKKDRKNSKVKKGKYKQ